MDDDEGETLDAWADRIYREDFTRWDNSEFDRLFEFLDRNPMTDEERERLARTADILEREQIMVSTLQWLAPLVKKLVREALKENAS